MSVAFCLVSERTPVASTLEITLFNKERESCSGGSLFMFLNSSLAAFSERGASPVPAR